MIDSFKLTISQYGNITHLHTEVLNRIRERHDEGRIVLLDHKVGDKNGY